MTTKKFDLHDELRAEFEKLTETCRLLFASWITNIMHNNHIESWMPVPPEFECTNKEFHRVNNRTINELSKDHFEAVERLMKIQLHKIDQAFSGSCD